MATPIFLAAPDMTRLRFGIKWEPLARDEIEFVHKFESMRKVRRRIALAGFYQGWMQFIADALRATYFLRGLAPAFVERRQDSEKAVQPHRDYIAQAKLPSFDLDLWCFCYDANGELAEYLSPLSSMRKNPGQVPPAIMHSGDEATGLSTGFDEQLMVNPAHIDAAITRIYFVVLSMNHGFNKVQGGTFTVMNTRNEAVVYSGPLHTPETRKMAVAVELSRADGGWQLRILQDYCRVSGDAQDKLDRRIHATLLERHVKKPEGVP